MKKAVFLDRDGILNHVVMRDGVAVAPRSIQDFRIVEESRELVESARKSGFLTIVVTNQPDVDNGHISLETINSMHSELCKAFKLDAVEVCCSADNAHPRRKPNPGMLLDAAKALNVDLATSFLIGDRDKDILAGKRAGVKTILLQTEYNKDIHGSADYNFNSVTDMLHLFNQGVI